MFLNFSKYFGNIRYNFSSPYLVYLCWSLYRIYYDLWLWCIFTLLENDIWNISCFWQRERKPLATSPIFCILYLYFFQVFCICIFVVILYLYKLWFCIFTLLENNIWNISCFWHWGESLSQPPNYRLFCVNTDK